MLMRTIDYDEDTTGNTETHIATDAAPEKIFGDLQHAYEEGFAASDGVRGQTAETGGKIRHPEKGDESISGRRVTNSIADQNPGLADN